MGSKLHRRRPRLPRFRRRTQPGAPPGLLVSDPAAPKGEIHLMAFNAEKWVETKIDDVSAIPDFVKQWPVTWINVDGLGDATVIARIGALFNLHKLALEDVVHVHQRAKTEMYGDYMFLVARMPLLEDPTRTEQISFFFSDRFVITFQEHPGGDCFNAIRARIRSGWGRGRTVRPDDLVHALLDGIVDHYFPVVERCGEQLDELEDEVIAGPLAAVVPKLHGVKRELLNVRRIIWPMRDAVNSLLREPTPLIANETRIYFRDVHDHTIQILDLVEAYRDIAGGMTEVYLARVSQRTNEIMKVLTIITTIFIPLTFIVGIYGMNFDPDSSPWNMPELRWYWGYPAVLLVMLVLALGMVTFFYRRGWLGKDHTANQFEEIETLSEDSE